MTRRPAGSTPPSRPDKSSRPRTDTHIREIVRSDQLELARRNETVARYLWNRFDAATIRAALGIRIDRLIVGLGERIDFWERPGGPP